ncbi:shikimate kinase [Chthonomonas calidirosea]|uniref:Shikimate kinase n=1 Tax=Chthonomonas calidirosea (strain DSM 23976 / ICMP 18418 / T49) TaxID=1303518 RepID=S0ETR5_CHTCT|nr:shikimate kinase [Chthonomonas calidirosea]CCW34615.1 shikimate kinase [Chthonomonas calidirosea T49]CEK13101.1 shikimate kinase [Chthonomonas calidirosea]CEK14276.1 shikimate kinase [Chthonomonas calidirosea]
MRSALAAGNHIMLPEIRSDRRPNLVLIGFMGTGKSTIGRLCARRLDMEFRDSDALIEQRTNLSIPQIFAEKGEPWFRRIERIIIEELASHQGLVIATGGGVPLDPTNVERLRASGLLVLLRAQPDVILERVGPVHKRPLLAQGTDPKERIRTLLAEREAAYRKAAHCVVDTSHCSPEESAEKVVLLYKVTQGG